MNFIIRNLKRIIRFWFSITKVNWIKFIKNYSSREGIVVVIPGIIKNYFINSLELDILNIAALLKNNQKVKIFIGKDFTKFSGRKICYNPSQLLNLNPAKSNAEFLAEAVRKAETQGNKIFYSSYEIQFWENKDLMHSKFEELNIRTPKTMLYDTTLQPQIKELHFPLLVKELHSHASLGVHKCESATQLQSLLSDENFRKKNPKIILQELLNIRRDLRVILSGDEILLHYWRINLGSEWKPTSTSHGSGVDFISFPEQWREYIITAFKKLNLTTGAFDVAWHNDDLNTEPYILEVSPFYMPNPPIDLNNKKYSYGQFKKKLLFKNSWDKLYIGCIFTIRTKVLNNWLNSNIK